MDLIQDLKVFTGANSDVSFNLSTPVQESLNENVKQNAKVMNLPEMFS